MSQPLRLLLIEDSDDDAALILRQLRQSGLNPASQRVDTSEAVRAALSAHTWDIVLCDNSLPGFNARDAFGLVREMNPEVPFIVVSGTIGEETAVEYVRAGVHDFILKDRLGRLPHAVNRELSEAARRADDARTRERLRRTEEALLRGEKLRALGQMAAGIAHDLRNLLSPLGIRLQLLDMQRLSVSPEELHANIEVMNRVLKNGVETIERLNAFSRQAPEARVEAVDVNDASQEAIEIARPRMASNRGTPCCLLKAFGAPPPINGNRSEIVSALVNLVVNAIDAMPSGGTITLRTGEEQGGVAIQVIDDGPGMAPEVEKRVFEPFFTTKGEAGMGLGLAMVYSTVLRHAGTLSLTTELGKGTTFSLWFPALSECGSVSISTGR